MKLLGFLKRSKGQADAPAGNRTLTPAELAAREAQQEAEAAAKAAAKKSGSTNPNRLRTSEEFRA